MLFYEPLFLVVFPAFYAVYLQLDRPRLKSRALVAFSFIFYFWSEPLFVMVLMLSAALDYRLGPFLTPQRPERQRRLLLAAAIATNLGILVVYKYTDFLLGNFNVALTAAGRTPLPLLQLALPVGVSFVVFEKITYLVDTYRGLSRPADRFGDYALFVLFFPKLLAGPILKYHEMQDQIVAPPPLALTDFRVGFFRFARGLGRKLLIADPLGAYAGQVFGADPGQLGAGTAWLGLSCFTLQIYFDFAGYSDMAIGLARMLGFHLRENFNSPYASRSLTEFWQRWHISLTTWIRDYLYIPLGGNRASVWLTYRNLWICFLLSGLWHGASWNFILWGAYNGLFLSLDRLFLRDLLNRLGPIPATAVTLFIVMIGWAIFRSESIDHLSRFLPVLFGHGTNGTAIPPALDVELALAIGIAISLFPATALFAPLRVAYAQSRALRVATMVLLLAICAIAVPRSIATAFQPFIYFRF